MKTFIDDGTMPADVIGRGDKATPLCMHQYNRVFGVSRVPGKGSDVMSVTPGSRHVAVMVDGQFYAFDAIRRDGGVLSVADMLVQLKAIAGMAAEAKASGQSATAPRIGTLTCVTGARVAWSGSVRAHACACVHCFHCGSML